LPGVTKKPLSSAAFFVWPWCAKIETMGEVEFQVNRQSTLRVEGVGEEQTPVIVIDDFAVDTSRIIDYACDSASFGDDSTAAYPGVRAALTREHMIAQLDALFPLLRRVYAVPDDLQMRPVNAVYSLVTTCEEDLRTLQRVPHIDSSKPYYMAITHYLGRGEFGGTGLYRHKPTGFETITEDRLSAYIKAGDAFLAAHGEPEQRYFGGSDDHYELFDCIDYRPNRLVAYPGYLLHSGLVDPARDIDPDPRTGRLTSNVFVDFS